MSDQTAIWDQFLRRQEDILAAYKTFADQVKDQQTLTRLHLDSLKGESIIYGASVNPQMADSISDTYFLDTFTYPPNSQGATVLPIELRNAKKIRILFHYSSTEGTLVNVNAPIFCGAVSRQKGSLPSIEFFQIGCVKFAGIATDDAIDGQFTSFTFTLDTILPVSGSLFLHLLAIGTGPFPGADFFAGGNAVINSRVFYQLIG